MKQNKNMTSINFRLSKAFKSAIEREAIKQETTVAGLIKERLRFCLPKNAPNGAEVVQNDVSNR